MHWRGHAPPVVSIAPGSHGRPHALDAALHATSRILVVRLREIGDVVFTTPALGALRARFPGASLTYLVEPPSSAVLAGHPHVDELIVVPPRGRSASPLRLSTLKAERALIARLRAARFDLAIDFHGGPRASILTWLSGARVRIGYTVVGRSWMYTTQVDRPRGLRPRHSVVNQWDLLLPLGIEPPSPDTHPVTMVADPDIARAVTDRLKAAGVSADHRIVVMHVSAGNPFRRWPIASFAALASGLAVPDARRRVIITSGPSERDAADQVIAAARAQLPDPARERIVACGEFSLAELRALVDRAALFIGGDSGPLHIASTSQVPIVGLYGPTLPARSAPWRPQRWTAVAVEAGALPCRPCAQRVCEPGDFRCLGGIGPDEVQRAAERALL